ncbi:uncharacterized protein [Antedon mediterranea]|uniref:uncharacterized protein n=1 Tax=Antedon mediterranea TaxID=105859 RepID=UPI003AF96A88
MEASTSTYKDLMDSLKLHDYSTSKELLEYGADPNCISSEDGVSPFHLAVGLDSKASLKLVELCIQYGGDPNVRSHEGMTPVMVAASWGRFQALQVLLANGGDPKLRDEDDKNALDHAIGADSWDCRQLLLQHINRFKEYDSDEDEPLGEPNYHYERYYSTSSSSSSSLSSSSILLPGSDSLFDSSSGSDGIFHGFDVTSPDHPFVFMKANPLPTQLNETVTIEREETYDKTQTVHSPVDNNNEQIQNNEQTESNNAHLEFIYHDEECGVSLIEKRCSLNDNSTDDTEILQNDSFEETVIYDWQDVFKEKKAKKENYLDELTYEQLHLELVSYGFNPGPITPTTKEIYFNKLMKLKEQKTKDSKNDRTSIEYSQELNDRVKNSTKAGDDEEEIMCAAFNNPDPGRKWREGVVKSSFNYLLLDPRVTRNLPQRSKHLSDSETFETFLSAVFYIGKGKRGRPYAHFYEGLEQLRNPRMKPSDKVQHIVDIWDCGLGVVSLHVFQGVIPVEAYTREACMVDSLSLARLTNVRRGDYYGVTSTWQSSKQKKLGSYLLHKCMQIFLIEGERQIRPVDLHGGNK